MPKKLLDTSLLLVGTRKGAFVFSSSDGRRTWKASGPHFRGKEIYHMVYDKRNKLLLASVEDAHWGPSVARSFDLGKTWSISDSPKFPKGSGESVKRVWNITPGPEDEPDVIYCGVEPAMLFRSDDKGASWKVNDALLTHGTRSKWQPGGGGLCLHTILFEDDDPRNLHVAISAVGTLNSRDGGNSWKFQNKNVLADYNPEKYPEFGQCVHKIARHKDSPNVLYQQNHCGVYRSDDGGENWKDIRNNLPSRFGFPMAVDANDPKRVYVVPLEGDFSRVSPDNKFLVWTTDNSGKEWYPLGRGFPKPAYFEVLREGMASDEEDPCGVYLGTKTGQLYASRNHGSLWARISDVLPEILSVSVSA
ncbi:MAG: WD40/YVTN/BNR-like repeat-containing protein [Nitrososphaerales archaeon]